MTPRPPLPEPDPAEVARNITYLAGLPEIAYQRELNLCITDSDDFEDFDPDAHRALVAAFRSEQLAERSLRAAEVLVNNANSDVREHQRQGHKDKIRGAERFRNLAGAERQLLDRIVKGQLARKGFIPSSPNPRRRAEKRLVNLVLRGDRPGPDVLRLLVEEEKQRDVDRRARERAERREAARAAKRRARER